MSDDSISPWPLRARFLIDDLLHETNQQMCALSKHRHGFLVFTIYLCFIREPIHITRGPSCYGFVLDQRQVRYVSEGLNKPFIYNLGAMLYRYGFLILRHLCSYEWNLFQVLTLLFITRDLVMALKLFQEGEPSDNWVS